MSTRRSKWPRGLRCRFAAASLLGFLARIPPKALMSVCCEWCVWRGRALCVGLITRPEESYRVWCVWVWSWSFENEGALSRVRPQRQKKKGDPHNHSRLLRACEAGSATRLQKLRRIITSKKKKRFLSYSEIGITIKVDRLKTVLRRSKCNCLKVKNRHGLSRDSKT